MRTRHRRFGTHARHPTLKTLFSDRQVITLLYAITSRNSMAITLTVGDTAPDFTLKDATGAKISLKSLRGSRVALYFYPADDTPGCTKEACDFRDNATFYKKKNIAVIGIVRMMREATRSSSKNTRCHSPYSPIRPTRSRHHMAHGVRRQTTDAPILASHAQPSSSMRTA